MQNSLITFSTRSLLLASAWGILCTTTWGRPPVRRRATLEHRLESEATVVWQGQALRTAARQVDETYGVSIWIDRRLDPDKKIDSQVKSASVQFLLNKMASECDARAIPFHTLVYLGPQQMSLELRTLSDLAEQSLEKTSPAIASRWKARNALAWKQPTEPKQLVQELTERVRVEWQGKELVPHDLWAPRTLPKLTRLQQAVLILSGFDLTCRVTRSGSLEVIPIKRPVRLTKTYDLTALSKRHRTTRPLSEADLRAILADTTNADWQREGDKLQLQALAEQHERIEDAIRGQKQPAKLSQPGSKRTQRDTKNQRRLTLTIKNQPLEHVLRQIAKQLNLEIEWAEGTAPLRQLLVSCQVKEATTQELIETLVTPAGLSAVQTADGFRIVKAEQRSPKSSDRKE